MIYKGSFIVVILDNLELAFQDSCTITYNVSTQAVLGNSSLREFVPLDYEIQVNVSGLRASQNEDKLISAARFGTILNLLIQNEEDGKFVQFDAFVTRLTQSAEAEQRGTYNVEFGVNRFTNIG